MVNVSVLIVQTFAPSTRRGECLYKEHAYHNHALCTRIHPYGNKRTVWYSVRRGQYLYIKYMYSMYKHSPLLHECSVGANMSTMSTVNREVKEEEQTRKNNNKFTGRMCDKVAKFSGKTPKRNLDIVSQTSSRKKSFSFQN